MLKDKLKTSIARFQLIRWMQLVPVFASRRPGRAALDALVLEAHFVLVQNQRIGMPSALEIVPHIQPSA
jgi:hypothetical protein